MVSYFILSKVTVPNHLLPAGKAIVWLGAAQLVEAWSSMPLSAAESVWILCNEHEITISCKCGFSIRNFAMKCQMVLRHKVLPAWEQYHLQNRTPHSPANPLLFLQASLSLAMNLLFGQYMLSWNSFLRLCSFSLCYVTARVFCQWLWQDTSQKSSREWWYPLSLQIFLHCR